MDDDRLAVTAFDAVSAPAALEFVRPLCASPAWLDAMVARRPHRTVQQALETSDAVVAGLSAQQLDRAFDDDADLAARRAPLAAGAGDDRARLQIALRDELAAAVRDRLRAVLE